ncbi:hypothetical protein [Xanthocytophaga agilis]|uniref:6-phosphogluconate dehydrogenase n=1 Tax=Xanthocytophaga agilis TaxID=3048010 RepID=A0AAE3R8D2_9BACT|nr:hypothetical protein [Xanthocytophaga agilis]MDJ1505551.1 hypothetical protein [Xanthocytophaga agilis]
MNVFKVFGIGIVLIGVILLAYFLFGSNSDGTRAGTIVKLSHKGVVFKTMEGQLNLGGLTYDSGSPASSLWDFSVDEDDKEVIDALKEANLNGHRVMLYYKEKFYKLPWRGETKYFVYKVEKAKN